MMVEGIYLDMTYLTIEKCKKIKSLWHHVLLCEKLRYICGI